jgi:hypothetical protein
MTSVALEPLTLVLSPYPGERRQNADRESSPKWI